MHVAALTGSGVSQESTLRTFRDPMGGVMAKYQPEGLAIPEAFERTHALVWKFYAAKRLSMGDLQPNAGHFKLSEMEQHIPQRPPDSIGGFLFPGQSFQSW